MRCSSLSRRLKAGSVPLTLVAIGLATTTLAAERKPLRMPNDAALAVATDELAYHTDLGIMGEVELIRERYPDGAIRIERQVTLDRDGNYVNHGGWKLFSTKGEVVAEGQYHFGQRVGLWTRWHAANDSGILSEYPFNQFKAPFMSQAHFSDGKMDGEWIITDSADRKVNQVSLKMGQRHGMAITWLPNGKVYRQSTYNYAVPTGDSLELNKKGGELERVATYVDGRRIVTRTTHYQGTKDKKTETMYLGAETVEKSPDDFWNIRFAKFATDGKDLRHGVAKAWFPNGRTESEGVYQFGKKSGIFTFWHENGQVASTGEYRDDKPEGNWVWWHENGQKSAFGRYENGVLIGEWRWWNESGKLTKQQTYDGTESASTKSESTYDVSSQPKSAETSIF